MNGNIDKHPDEIGSIPGVGTFSLSALERAVERDRYLADPVKWVTDRLGGFLWSKQKEILYSIRDNRRTAVQSCHGPGKSYVAARAIAWWIDCHPPGTVRVITSAPTGDQVKAILWSEIGRAHSQGKLAGRLNQTEWWMDVGGREEMVAVGRKPKDYATSAFSGIHERYVFVVFDEADGIPKSLWNSAEGLLSNDECRFLSIGNPEDPTSEFFNECKPGSGTNVIRISAFGTPNFTGEYVPEEIAARLVSPLWVEERKRKWGEASPLYISKVLGLFPELTADGLIPISWIRAAQERDLEPSDPVELGVDVGGGVAANVIAARRGPVVRVPYRDHSPDTMKTLSAVLDALRATGATSAKVDYIGIGHGAVDRAREMASDQNVKRETPQLALEAAKILGVEVGRTAKDKEHYINLRAEGYWTLRERFREGNIDIDPNDEELAAQLSAIRYKGVGGRTQVESKDEMKRRGVASPDSADAVMLAFLDVDSEGDDWITF